VLRRKSASARLAIHRDSPGLRHGSEDWTQEAASTAPRVPDGPGGCRWPTAVQPGLAGAQKPRSWRRRSLGLKPCVNLVHVEQKAASARHALGRHAPVTQFAYDAHGEAKLLSEALDRVPAPTGYRLGCAGRLHGTARVRSRPDGNSGSLRSAPLRPRARALRGPRCRAVDGASELIGGGTVDSARRRTLDQPGHIAPCVRFI